MQSEEESTRGVLFWIYEEEEQEQVRSWLGTRQVSNWPMFFGSVYLGTHSLRRRRRLVLCLWAPNPNLLPEKAESSAERRDERDGGEGSNHRGLMCDGSMIGPSLQDCRAGGGRSLSDATW